jgi:hypothetical protein
MNASSNAYHGQIALGSIASAGAPADLALPKVQFVHYPDCQQLIVWLPGYGRDYGALRVERRDGADVWFAGTVDDKLSGSIQLLFDTVPLPPGSWRLCIEHRSGFRHVVEFDKLAAGVALPVPTPPTAAAPPASNVAGPHVYRDAAGERLPNQDVQLRERAQRDLVARFTRHLEYEGNYRSGYVTYVEGDLRIRLLHEMGGGGCKFYVEIPPPERWQAATGVSVSRRDEIVRWVAAALQREQAPSWRYEIEADQIVFR